MHSSKWGLACAKLSHGREEQQAQHRRKGEQPEAPPTTAFANPIGGGAPLPPAQPRTASLASILRKLEEGALALAVPAEAAQPWAACRVRGVAGRR